MHMDISEIPRGWVMCKTKGTESYGKVHIACMKSGNKIRTKADS